jgi:hypothetical protein
MSEDMVKASAYYPPSFIDMVDEVAHEYSWSRSEVLRYLSMNEVEEGGQLSKSDIIECIDDTKLELARKEKQEEQLKKKQKLKEKKHSFEDRIRGFFRQRLEGDKAYLPVGMDDLADGYEEDAEIWFDSSEEIEEKRAYVEEQRQIYEAGYFARQHADEIDAELDPDDRNRSWMDIGEDLFSLRSRIEEVRDHITRVADNQGVGWDSDAVIDSVCNRWSVGTASVMLLMEQMVANDNDRIHDMLRKGGDAVADPTAEGRQLTGADPEEEATEIEIPTEPTEDMIEVAVEKYRVTGSVETTRVGLENADHLDCTIPQAEQAAEIAEQRVESDETASTEGVS